MGDDTLRAAWAQLVSESDMEAADPDRTYKVATISPSRSAVDEAGGGSAGDSEAAPQDSLAALRLAGDATRVKPLLDLERERKQLTLRGQGGESTLNLPERDSIGVTLEEEIGRGGMGLVYRATQSSLRRPVAVKTTRRRGRAIDTEFLSESFVTAFLDHPNIVPVHDLAVSEDDTLLLSMKLVTGRSWREALDADRGADGDKSALDDDRLLWHLEILESVCDGIGFAHSRGIVHCDLKPTNVMLGEYGEVLVMDWGVAVDIRPESELTLDSLRGVHRSEVVAPRGTPVYMPPELTRAEGEKIGPWTDTYLLGGILHELLKGSPPHSGTTLAEVILKSCAGVKPTFVGRVPEQLRAICVKALATDPADRFQSAGELKEALQQFRRHRESAMIVERAGELLESCRRSVTGHAELSEKERSQVYADFSEVVAAFRQARHIAPELGSARAGEFAAHRDLADFALRNGDLALAASELSRFSDDHPDAATLRDQLGRALEDERRRERQGRLMRFALAFTVSLIVVGLSWGLSEQARVAAELERQNTEIKAQNIRADQARRLAEKRAAFAGDAISKLTDEVDANLRGVIGKAANDARLRLLRSALDFLVGERDAFETVGERTLRSVEATINIARVHRGLGDFEAARIEFRDAVHSARKALADGPDPATARELHREICRGLIGLGRIQVEIDGKTTEAEQSLEAAMGEARQCLSTPPTETERLGLLYPILMKRSLVAQKEGKHGRSRDLALRAAELVRDMAEKEQSTTGMTLARSALAGALARAGAVSQADQKLGQAETELREAEAILTALEKLRTLVRDDLLKLINVRVSLGAVYEKMTRVAKSRRYHLAAWRQAQSLSELDPENLEVREALLSAGAAYAFSLEYHEDADEALAVNRTIVSYAETFQKSGDSSARTRGRLARSWIRIGRIQHKSKKDLDASVQAFARGIVELRRLVAETPGNSSNMESLVLALNYQADAFLAKGQNDEAKRNLEEAAEGVAALLKTAPENRRLLKIRIAVTSTLASQQRESGELAKAEATIAQAIEAAQTMVGLDRTSLANRRMRAVMFYKRGLILKQRKAWADAARAFDAAAADVAELAKKVPAERRTLQVFQREAETCRQAARGP